MNKERYEILHGLHASQGDNAYSLEVFGDALAKDEGYKSLRGMEAVHYYLIHKFSWLPKDVRSMSAEDIRFILTEKMEGWVLPKAARGTGKKKD